MTKQAARCKQVRKGHLPNIALLDDRHGHVMFLEFAAIGGLLIHGDGHVAGLVFTASSGLNVLLCPIQALYRIALPLHISLVEAPLDGFGVVTHNEVGQKITTGSTGTGHNRILVGEGVSKGSRACCGDGFGGGALGCALEAVFHGATAAEEDHGTQSEGMDECCLISHIYCGCEEGWLACIFEIIHFDLAQNALDRIVVFTQFFFALLEHFTIRGGYVGNLGSHRHPKDSCL